MKLVIAMSSYLKFQTDRRKFAQSSDMTKRVVNKYKEKSIDNNIEENILHWVTFYRRNMNAFVEHYLGLHMHPYQILLLYLMNICAMVVIVAARAAAKSYIIAVYSCSRCILYPGTRVVVASATKKQAKLIVTEKIQKELIPNSITLAREIKSIKTGNNDIEVFFHNGSSIVVVPASENARGYRGTVMIYEEFRMIKKKIIETVLSPFLFVRQTSYLNKPEYEHLVEEPIEIYISSAWLKQHWMWQHMKLAIRTMYKKPDEAVLIGFDYAITLKHKIRTKKFLQKEKKKLGYTSFAIEYENLMLGETENAYYTFDLINKCQKLKKAFLCKKDINVIEKKKNKFDIPKIKGEIRIVAVDISMISGDKNDNSTIICYRAIPNKDYYERQVPFIDSMNGGNTNIQAIRIKQVFKDFNADYLVLDTQNAGISVFDELGKVLYDEDRDVEYEAWTCFNDDKTASRIKNSKAIPIVYSVKASATFNHEMHMLMKDVLEMGKIKFLINSSECEDNIENTKALQNLSPEDKGLFLLPYLQTEFLINEMVNLTYEYNENSKTIKLLEPRNGRKDRYIALAYGNYFIQMLERDLYIDELDDDDDLILY